MLEDVVMQIVLDTTMKEHTWSTSYLLNKKYKYVHISTIASSFIHCTISPFYYKYLRLVCHNNFVLRQFEWHDAKSAIQIYTVVSRSKQVVIGPVLALPWYVQSQIQGNIWSYKGRPSFPATSRHTSDFLIYKGLACSKMQF